jgi:hypothetical protein
MPLQKLLQAAVPFMAGGAVAIFVSELTRGTTRRGAQSFSDAWFSEAERAPEHLWTGEPTFDWGD